MNDFPLASIDTFIRGRLGTHLEAEVFAALLHCAFVVRSFEFALADGALYASEGPYPSGNYTERFWQLNEQVRMFRNSTQHSRRALVLFDIKSSVSRHAQDQIYITQAQQQAQVGFYIAICAANPDYVEVIPNRFGGNIESLDKRKMAVNLSRKSYLPPTAYGSLSPCNSPYRMPIRLLPQALANIQHCTHNSCDYINPWTGVQFTGWRPRVEHGNEFLAPVEDSQHYSSFKGIIEIWRAVRVAKSQYGIPINFELVNLQPRLADFKLLVPSQTHPARRQLFVQYKIDAVYRSPASLLTRVGIARNHRKNVSYYFTEHERFDYLFYQFDYQGHQKTTWTQFFFLPERVIPDEFYLTESKEGDFSRDEFQPYWITMDMAGRWVQQVFDIIQRFPQPRKPGHRPSRPPKVSTQPKAALSTSQAPGHVARFHQKLFYTLMLQCATRRSGLILVLSRSNPLGDFGYCRYKWKSDEQESFLSTKCVPATISQLPAATPIVPFMVYTKNRESTSRGPTLTAAEFERLDMCPQSRLLIFDLFGQDSHDLFGPLLAVPSDDISPTDKQCALFESNRGKGKEDEFEARVPLLAELLHTGLNPIDYTISTAGPLVFEEEINPWGGLWVLLNKASGVQKFSHPYTCSRDPTNFRVPLQEIHQSLADRHSLVDREPRMFDTLDTELEDEAELSFELNFSTCVD